LALPECEAMDSLYLTGETFFHGENVVTVFTAEYPDERIVQGPG
jgi:hypothetical protein